MNKEVILHTIHTITPDELVEYYNQGYLADINGDGEIILIKVQKNENN